MSWMTGAAIIPAHHMACPRAHYRKIRPYHNPADSPGPEQERQAQARDRVKCGTRDRVKCGARCRAQHSSDHENSIHRQQERHKNPAWPEAVYRADNRAQCLARRLRRFFQAQCTAGLHRCKMTTRRNAAMIRAIAALSVPVCAARAGAILARAMLAVACLLPAISLAASETVPAGPNAGSAGEEPVLHIGTTGDHLPFSLLSGDGQFYGFAIDVVSALCAQMNRQCLFQLAGADSLADELRRGDHDMGLFFAPPGEDERVGLSFTNPYYSHYIAFVAPQGNFIDIDLLKNYRTGYQKGSRAERWVLKNYGPLARARSYDSLDGALANLFAGQREVIVMELVPALEWLSRYPGFSQATTAILDEPAQGVALREADAGLRAALNEAILAIRQNGVYRDITRRYFGQDIF